MFAPGMLLVVISGKYVIITHVKPVSCTLGYYKVCNPSNSSLLHINQNLSLSLCVSLCYQFIYPHLSLSHCVTDSYMHIFAYTIIVAGMSLEQGYFSFSCTICTLEPLCCSWCLWWAPIFFWFGTGAIIAAAGVAAGKVTSSVASSGGCVTDAAHSLVGLLDISGDLLYLLRFVWIYGTPLGDPFSLLSNFTYWFYVVSNSFYGIAAIGVNQAWLPNNNLGFFICDRCFQTKVWVMVWGSMARIMVAFRANLITLFRINLPALDTDNVLSFPKFFCPIDRST